MLSVRSPRPLYSHPWCVPPLITLMPVWVRLMSKVTPFFASHCAVRPVTGERRAGQKIARIIWCRHRFRCECLCIKKDSRHTMITAIEQSCLSLLSLLVFPALQPGYRLAVGERLLLSRQCRLHTVLVVLHNSQSIILRKVNNQCLSNFRKK